jgi:hypothetical protein
MWLMADASSHSPRATRWPGQHRRAPGPAYSEGARRLWGALVQLGIDTAEAAARVRVTGTTVLRWLYGDRVPERAAAAAIQREFGIDPSLWDVKPVGKHADELPFMRAPTAA